MRLGVLGDIAGLLRRAPDGSLWARAARGGSLSVSRTCRAAPRAVARLVGICARAAIPAANAAAATAARATHFLTAGLSHQPQHVDDGTGEPSPVLGSSTTPEGPTMAPRCTTYQTPRQEIIDAIPNERTSSPCR